MTMVQQPFLNSKIATLLKSNGVGFVKVFFRSNLSPAELNDGETTGEWMLDFSDGKIYLGSLKLDCNDFDSMSGKEEQCPFVVSSGSLKEGAEWHKSLNGEFYFQTQYHNFGECLIFE